MKNDLKAFKRQFVQFRQRSLRQNRRRKRDKAQKNKQQIIFTAAVYAQSNISTSTVDKQTKYRPSDLNIKIAFVAAAGCGRFFVASFFIFCLSYNTLFSFESKPFTTSLKYMFVAVVIIVFVSFVMLHCTALSFVGSFCAAAQSFCAAAQHSLKLVLYKLSCYRIKCYIYQVVKDKYKTKKEILCCCNCYWCLQPTSQHYV